MSKIISFMHMSLDGFVAGPGGEMDWIRVDDEIFDHISSRISQTDTALYGRVTYQMMEGYWPTAADQPAATKHDIEHAQWYKAAHKIVLSTTMQDAGRIDTTIISDRLPERMAEIKNQGDREDILLFGSPTATHALMQQGLIDGYWLFVNPVILGQGIPLFADVRDKVRLQLIATRSFTAGVTELDYLVDRQ